MSGRLTEADRLRLHNEELRYALANNITVLEARHRLAQLKFAQLEERVHPPLKPALRLTRGTVSSAIAPAGHHFWWQDRD